MIYNLRCYNSASLHQFENPAQEQEMTFICNQPEVYQNIPGTPNTANKPYRPSSAMSSDSVEAWAEDSHMTPPTRQTKRLGSGKVSPAPVPSVHKTVSKQNSTSRLIDNDTDSGTSTPEEHEIKVPTMTFNVAKALMNHEDATTYRKRPHSRDELKRQSSDSKLLNTDEGRGSPFTKPKLHKRMTWATNSEYLNSCSLKTSRFCLFCYPIKVRLETSLYVRSIFSIIAIVSY